LSKIITILIAIIMLPVFMWLINKHYHTYEKYNLLQRANSILAQSGFSNANASLNYLDATLTGTVNNLKEKEVAQKLVDALDGIRVRPEDNKLKIHGWLNIKRSLNNKITLSGLLPGNLNSHLIFDYFTAAADKQQLQFEPDVLAPGLFELADSDKLVKLLFESDGARELNLKKDTLTITGDTTRDTQSSWRQFINNSLADIKHEFNTELYPSVYHLPGYRIESDLGKSQAKTLAARLKAHTIYFASGSAKIDKNEIDKINLLAQIINETDNSIKFVLGGHTDASGDASLNIRLGKERAQSVLDKLKAQKVTAERIELVSFGATQVIDKTASEEHKRLSRRVEILLK